MPPPGGITPPGESHPVTDTDSSAEKGTSNAYQPRRPLRGDRLHGPSLALGASACGAGGVDKAALVEKIKQEPDLKGIPDSVVDCMADVALKYGDKDDLQAYVDGDKKLEDVKGTDSDEAEKAAEKCVSST